jgi:hypothetical protein
METSLTIGPDAPPDSGMHKGSRPRCQPASQPIVRPCWRSMRARRHASWPNRAASHKRFDRDIMFRHVLETAARPAACWSAARPREATSTTTMLISPPPGLAPNGLSPLLGASRLAGGNFSTNARAASRAPLQQSPQSTTSPLRFMYPSKCTNSKNDSNQVTGTARSLLQPILPIIPVILDPSFKLPRHYASIHAQTTWQLTVYVASAMQSKQWSRWRPLAAVTPRQTPA